MDFNEKKAECLDYFMKLADLLKETHVIVGSCKADASVYLVPIGTESEITYHSKPADSYRYSDHWNWYASLHKCENPNYIQCLNVDMPRAKARTAEGKYSKPVLGICVAKIGDDGKYHTVYGEKFDRKQKTWSWIA